MAEIIRVIERNRDYGGNETPKEREREREGRGKGAIIVRGRWTIEFASFKGKM